MKTNEVNVALAFARPTPSTGWHHAFPSQTEGKRLEAILVSPGLHPTCFPKSSKKLPTSSTIWQEIPAWTSCSKVLRNDCYSWLKTSTKEQYEEMIELGETIKNYFSDWVRDNFADSTLLFALFVTVRMHVRARSWVASVINRYNWRNSVAVCLSEHTIPKFVYC